jgi:hypothetical protein
MGLSFAVIGALLADAFLILLGIFAKQLVNATGPLTTAGRFGDDDFGLLSSPDFVINRCARFPPGVICAWAQAMVRKVEVRQPWPRTKE